MYIVVMMFYLVFFPTPRTRFQKYEAVPENVAETIEAKTKFPGCINL